MKPGPNWQLSVDEATSVQSLIGNLTLLSAKKNVSLGNVAFHEKVKSYRDSAYRVTNTLEAYGTQFGMEQVKSRQAELAKIAVKTWPLTFV
jgi:hypothetical protein